MAEAQRLTFLAHNRNHVTLFGDAARQLANRGVAVAFATIADHPDQKHAATALEQQNVPHIDISQLEAKAGPHDVVVVGNDWGPRNAVHALEKMQRRGAYLVGVIEGARFAFPRQYTRVAEILVWGPSGQAAFAKPTRIVGSPGIERALRIPHKPSPKPHVLINYKFAYGAEDGGFAWGRAAIDAAVAIDRDYVLSTHPASEGVPSDAHRSGAPFHDLLAKATLLVTRSSTVIYEALTAGVSVIYFPLADEKRAEFADPMGAFQTAESAEQLTTLVRAHGENPAFDPARATPFLEHHVSIDPTHSADSRLALALADILEQRPQAAPARPSLLGRLGDLWRGAAD